MCVKLYSNPSNNCDVSDETEGVEQPISPCGANHVSSGFLNGEGGVLKFRAAG